MKIATAFKMLHELTYNAEHTPRNYRILDPIDKEIKALAKALDESGAKVVQAAVLLMKDAHTSEEHAKAAEENPPAV